MWILTQAAWSISLLYPRFKIQHIFIVWGMSLAQSPHVLCHIYFIKQAGITTPPAPRILISPLSQTFFLQFHKLYYPGSLGKEGIILVLANFLPVN